MRASIRSLSLSRLAGAVAAVWLPAAGAAWAGDGGGASFQSLQAYIANNVCATFSVANCPVQPTVSQAVLQLAAYYFSSLGAVRSNFNIPVSVYADALNPSRPPAAPGGLTCKTPPCPDPLNQFSLPIDPSVLQTLRPLTFTAANNRNGTATPTQPDDPNWNIRFYAVGARSASASPLLPSVEPDTLLLFYEDTLRSNQNLKPGQVSASFSLPLMVLNTDRVTERPVSAILQYIAPNKKQLDCSASTIKGDFNGTGTPQILTPPSAVGIDCAVAFGSSGAVFELSVPLLVTLNSDSITVDNPLGFFPGQSANAFPDDAPGFPPPSCPGLKCILGFNGSSIGIGPTAAPLCTAQTCPPMTTPPTPPATPNYAFCANLPTNGNGQPPVPAVGAFYAISSAGAEVLLSAPLAPTGPIVCPLGM
jgi:hypothetical protein